jgi:hypothetical protein
MHLLPDGRFGAVLDRADRGNGLRHELGGRDLLPLAHRERQAGLRLLGGRHHAAPFLPRPDPYRKHISMAIPVGWVSVEEG